VGDKVDVEGVESVIILVISAQVIFRWNREREMMLKFGMAYRYRYVTS
jgi:hypothetical protein